MMIGIAKYFQSFENYNYPFGHMGKNSAFFLQNMQFQRQNWIDKRIYVFYFSAFLTFFLKGS